MSEGSPVPKRTRVVLNLTQKIALREWMVERHDYICERNMRRNEVADKATEELKFLVTPGHIPDVVKSLPELSWPFSPWANESPATIEELVKFREQVELVEIGLSDVNAKVAKLESEYASLAANVRDMRDKFERLFAMLDSKTTGIAAEVKSLRESLYQMNTTLSLAMTELGFVKMDNGLKKAVAAVAKPNANHKPA